MAARALQFQTEEGGAEDMPFGRQRRIIVSGDAETRAAAFHGGSSHLDEFTHHTVDGFTIPQRVQQEPAEGARGVQAFVHDGGILRQHILPVAHPVVCVALIGEQALDDERALVRCGVGHEGAGLSLGRRSAHGVEEYTAEEGGIPHHSRGGYFLWLQGRCRPHGPLLHPALQRGNLSWLEPLTLRRHAFFVVVASQAGQQGAGGGIAWNDRCLAGVSALQRGLA